MSDATEALLWEGLNLTVVGLTVVFAVLALVAVAVRGLKWLDARLQPPARPAPASEAEAQIDHTTLVLIAAAVATLVRGRYHITKVRRLPQHGPGDTAWSQQHRAVLLASHRIEKK